MKPKILKPLVAGTVCLISLFILQPVQAHDHVGFSIQIGSAPPRPPVFVEQRWAAPSPEAVWVEPHYEWMGGRWVWVRGYYMYPPQPSCIWVPPHHEYYRHDHYWVGGHWDRR